MFFPLQTTSAKPWSLAVEILQEGKLAETEHELEVVEDKTCSEERAGSSCTFEGPVYLGLENDQ